MALQQSCTVCRLYLIGKAKSITKGRWLWRPIAFNPQPVVSKQLLRTAAPAFSQFLRNLITEIPMAFQVLRVQDHQKRLVAGPVHTHEYPQSNGVYTFCQKAQAAKVRVPDPHHTLYCDIWGKEPAAVRAPLPVRVFFEPSPQDSSDVVSRGGEVVANVMYGLHGSLHVVRRSSVCPEDSLVNGTRGLSPPIP